jgi:hypothetical protein
LLKAVVFCLFGIVNKPVERSRKVTSVRRGHASRRCEAVFVVRDECLDRCHRMEESAIRTKDATLVFDRVTGVPGKTRPQHRVSCSRTKGCMPLTNETTNNASVIMMQLIGTYQMVFCDFMRRKVSFDCCSRGLDSRPQRKFHKPHEHVSETRRYQKDDFEIVSRGGGRRPHHP